MPKCDRLPETDCRPQEHEQLINIWHDTCLSHLHPPHSTKEEQILCGSPFTRQRQKRGIPLHHSGINLYSNRLRPYFSKLVLQFEYYNHLRHGTFVFIRVCWFVCLFVNSVAICYRWASPENVIFSHTNLHLWVNPCRYLWYNVKMTQPAQIAQCYSEEQRPSLQRSSWLTSVYRVATVSSPGRIAINARKGFTGQGRAR